MKYRPMSEAPRDPHGPAIRLVFRDAAGAWISPVPYSWNGSRWAAPSGLVVPARLEIVGWIPADAEVVRHPRTA